MKDIVRDMPALVALDLHEHVARIEHTRRFDALVASHLDDGLCWNEHFYDFVLQVRIADARLQAIAHLLLVTGVSMKYVPLLHQKTFNAFLRPARPKRATNHRNDPTAQSVGQRPTGKLQRK